MTLREKQVLFAGLVPDLIGYVRTVMHAEVRFGEVWRTDEQAEINALGVEGRARVAALIEAEFPDLAAKIRNNGEADGIRNSLHCDRLAVDVALDINGVWQTAAAPYAPLGAFWKTRHPLCAWGGDFGDADHFSVMDGGRR
jgi:hypothetical protein